MTIWFVLLSAGIKTSAFQMSKFRGSITLSIFSLSTLSNYHYWQSPKTRYWRLVRPYQTGIPPARLLALIWAHSPDLLLNFVFKLYHKTCEQFYRNFGLYEKSPNSFLPGLPRSIINQFRFHNLICLRLASVHLPHPFHLVFGF